MKKLFVVLLFALSFGLSGMGLPLPEDKGPQDLDSNPFWEGDFPALPATDPEDFSWLQQPGLEVSKSIESDHSCLEDFQPGEEAVEVGPVGQELFEDLSFGQLSGSKRSTEEDFVDLGSVNSKRPKKHICNWEGCSKAFYDATHLNIHKRVHTGERPYVCEWDGCSKAFTQSIHLRDHKMTHTGEKLYVCGWDGCGKAFQSSHLRDHEMTHTGERPYVCERDGCGKAFTQSSHLRNHKRTHTGERPYVCDRLDCDKAFADSGNLKVHKRTHTGERPYVCDICGNAFVHSGHFKRHKKSKHTEFVV